MVSGLGGSKLAMPIEITQFCHLYTLQRLAKLPEVRTGSVALITGDRTLLEHRDERHMARASRLDG